MRIRLYLEDRRSTRATRDSCSSSLAEELPGAFQLVDTASRQGGGPRARRCQHSA